jgi:predicted transcriptional regulator
MAMNPIFASLDRLRRSRGVSQRDFCIACNVPRSRYNLCRAGLADPTVAQFRRMIAYFGLLEAVDDAVCHRIDAEIAPCWRSRR